jgi:hypothetical protein
MEEKRREMKEYSEEEKSSQIWVTDKEERMEKASADILKKERVDLLKKEYGSKVTVNPPTAGGKILKDAVGVRAVGAICGYPSKKCD